VSFIFENRLQHIQPNTSVLITDQICLLLNSLILKHLHYRLFAVAPKSLRLRCFRSDWDEILQGCSSNKYESIE